MDGRVPQPADRRVVSRSAEPAYRQAEEQQPANSYTPQPTRGQESSRRSGSQEPSSKKGLFWTIGIIGVVIILALVGWTVYSSLKGGSGTTGIDSGRYQAIFLSNGQIYFGKLQNFNDTTFKITKVYYPQAESTDENEATPQTTGNVQIIRLGDEVHGPDNEMFIVKDQVLYYENLKEDSRVSKLIEQNESK